MGRLATEELCLAKNSPECLCSIACFMFNEAERLVAFAGRNAAKSWVAQLIAVEPEHLQNLKYPCDHVAGTVVS